MIHECLDLHHWKHMCSLQRLRDASEGKSPVGGAITGPCDIAALEQLRDLSYAHLPDLKRVPTDIFIWSFGETDQRMVTNIGTPCRVLCRDQQSLSKHRRNPAPPRSRS